MDIKFFRPDDLSREQIEDFWKQDINMDDWDYMFIFHTDLKMKITIYDKEVALEPEEYTIERLLNGCCSNSWYMGYFEGEPVFIGVAYHS